MTAYNTFEKLVEQCFDYALERSADGQPRPVDVECRKARINLIIENIYFFIITSGSRSNTKSILAKAFNENEYQGAISIIRDYLSVYPPSFEGHARLREMVIYISEYMDYHDEPKGDNFYKI